jgi:hypothetical protein
MLPTSKRIEAYDHLAPAFSPLGFCIIEAGTFVSLWPVMQTVSFHSKTLMHVDARHKGAVVSKQVLDLCCSAGVFGAISNKRLLFSTLRALDLEAKRLRKG